MNVPSIHIDDARCREPKTCSKCQRVCPDACFGLYRDKSEEGKYVLDVATPSLCTYPTCDACLKVCPLDAISISLP